VKLSFEEWEKAGIKMEKTSQKEKRPFCQFCEHTGIVTDSGAYLTGAEPLVVCPKCVEPLCKCGGREPYYCNEDGRVRECPCRGLRIKIDKVASLYGRSGIERKYRWRFINEFNSINKQTDMAKKHAYEIITKFPDVEKGLFLWGNPGTGKTLLSTIILTELIVRMTIEGRFLKISRSFFDRLRATFTEGSAQYGMASEIEREIADVDVLVIDDFGVQRNTAWEQETLYNLVDARYEAQKFTIFTSNLDPDKTMRDLFEGRILSRIREMCRIVDLSGPDQREK
jgi:DNA replication protein DnaC